MAKTKRCKQCKTKHLEQFDIETNGEGVEVKVSIGFGMCSTPNNLSSFCNKDCLADFLIENRKGLVKKQKASESKEYKKVTTELKKKFGLNKTSSKERAKRERATKEACHAYIRMRDKGLSCVCCPEGSEIDVVHAGHFKASDKYAILRYDEDNIHAQRAHCNMFQGGDSGLYEFNLRKRIGNQKVDELYMKIEGSSNVFRHSIDELKTIEQYYKDKLKGLQDVRIYT